MSEACFTKTDLHPHSFIRCAVPGARKHAGKGTQHSKIPPKRKLLMVTIFETDLNQNFHVPTESLHTGKIVAVLYKITHYAIKTCGRKWIIIVIIKISFDNQNILDNPVVTIAICRLMEEFRPPTCVVIISLPFKKFKKIVQH
jgi:hypothetical protein